MWRPLALPASALSEPMCLEATLACGQAFGWRRLPAANHVTGSPKKHTVAQRQLDEAASSAEAAAGTTAVDAQPAEWLGTLNRQAVLLKQSAATPRTAATVALRCLGEDSPTAHAAAAAEAQDYFQLSTPLKPLYVQWAGADHRFRAVAEVVAGLRVLRQDPVECLISFICSSNNNISRITQMLEKLRYRYGPRVAEHAGHVVHAFPTLEELAVATESELREMGFGYRAKFIVASVCKLRSLGGSEYLHDLRSKPLTEVRGALTGLAGVGPKVADCVALFSLDQHGAIPVDTHVWQIACRDLDTALRDAKSLTPTVYDRVGQLFRGRYGDYAGWAHSILFAAELPAFRHLLPADVVADMDTFRDAEKALKAAAKDAKRGNTEAAASNSASPTKSPKKPKRSASSATDAKTTVAPAAAVVPPKTSRKAKSAAVPTAVGTGDDSHHAVEAPPRTTRGRRKEQS